MEPRNHSISNAGACTLASVKTGQVVCILSINAGRRLQSHLLSIGIMKGKCVTVVKNDRWGPVVLSTDNNRLTLGRGAADKIVVSPTPPAASGRNR